MRRNERGKAVFWILAFIVAAAVAATLVFLSKSTGTKGFVLQGKNFGNAPQIYLRQCSPCHGEEGFGDGKAAQLLRPKPRDFSYGKFLLVSTDNRIPTDEDLFRTISRGMPGSAMPPWGQLPEQDRRSLVRYVRGLAFRGKVMRLMGKKGGPQAEKPMPQKEAEKLVAYHMEIGKPIELTPETPPTPEALERGREIFLATCAKCHGKDGTGNGPENMEDDLGNKAYPRDFTKGVFKGSPEPKELAYRILGGMPGSPMPTNDFERPNDIWAVVNYLEAMVPPGAQDRVTQHRQTIAAKRINQLPNEPDSPAWETIPATYLAMMPLWWRDQRVEGIDVRAVHDGKNIMILLTWKDPSHNEEQAHVNSFTDAAALQFSNEENPPFFGMGDQSAPVNIWLWKAVWEKDMITKNDPGADHPRGMMDFDFAVKRPGPATTAFEHGKVEDRDPTFYSGWSAGNLTSNPHRETPVENLNAKGFGSLQAQGLLAQLVKGKGVWKDGVWRYVFIRPLAVPGKGQIEFRPGRSVRVGFAVWDGEAGDRDGQKSVTIWHNLALEK